MNKNKKQLSRNLSDRIYSGFLQWRENLLSEENALIVVEGKRDVCSEFILSNFTSNFSRKKRRFKFFIIIILIPGVDKRNLGFKLYGKL